MGNQSVISIEAVIDYIESHLDGKLELETVAEAVHYSKYHLHRLFTETVGMTIQDRKSTRLNSSHIEESRMPSSA